jgi:hypothetical protein
MDVPAVGAMTDDVVFSQITDLILAGSKSGWLGIALSLVVSAVLGGLYLKMKKSRNIGAEETEKIRHTASSQILTDNIAKEREHARAEAAVDDFFKDDGDGTSGKSLGDHNNPL